MWGRGRFCFKVSRPYRAKRGKNAPQSPRYLVACIVLGWSLVLLRRLDFAVSLVETYKVFWPGCDFIYYWWGIAFASLLVVRTVMNLQLILLYLRPLYG